VEKGLCALSCFFNPLRSPNLVNNWIRARSESFRQGLAMVVVELSFYPKDEWIVRPDDKTIVVRVEGNLSHHLMFQKEALLNIALRSIPSEWKCNLISWIDGDVIIQDGWIEATVGLFRSNPQVNITQPYTLLKRLAKTNKEIGFDNFGRRGKAEDQVWNSAASSGLSGLFLSSLCYFFRLLVKMSVLRLYLTLHLLAHNVCVSVFFSQDIRDIVGRLDDRCWRVSDFTTRPLWADLTHCCYMQLWTHAVKRE